MKWFKHDTNASSDLRIEMLEKRFGNDGYAVYFKILEIIGFSVKEDNLDEWGMVDRLYSVEILAKKCGVSIKKLRDILSYADELGLFSKKDGRLFCARILKRLDEYADRLMRKSGKSIDIVPTKTGEDRALDIDRDIDRDKEKDNNNIIASSKSTPPQKDGKWVRPPLEKQTSIQRIVYHLEDTLHTTITNWGKQSGAIGLMTKAGYTEEQIVKAITYMATRDDFFKDKPFDLTTVLNHLPRLKAESEKRRQNATR